MCTENNSVIVISKRWNLAPWLLNIFNLGVVSVIGNAERGLAGHLNLILVLNMLHVYDFFSALCSDKNSVARIESFIAPVLTSSALPFLSWRTLLSDFHWLRPGLWSSVTLRPMMIVWKKCHMGAGRGARGGGLTELLGTKPSAETQRMDTGGQLWREEEARRQTIASHSGEIKGASGGPSASRYTAWVCTGDSSTVIKCFST